MFKRRRAARHESWAQLAIDQHQRTGEPDMLDVAVQQAALALDASGRRTRDDRLLLLAEALVERGESAPSSGDLEEACAILEHVWEGDGSVPSRRGRCALDTAWVLANLGVRDGSAATIDEAFTWIDRARELLQGDAEQLMRITHTQGYALVQRYWLRRDDRDLDTLHDLQVAAADGNEWAAIPLATWYAAALVARYQARADVADLRTAIDLLEQRLGDARITTDSTWRVRLEVLLGQSLLHLYECEFDPALLDRALTWCERALLSTDPEDSAHLGRLDLVLWARSHVQQRRGTQADFDGIIHEARSALARADRWPGPIIDARLNLSEVLLDRFDIHADPADVAEAAALTREALQADPSRTSDEPRRGRVTLAQYEAGGDLATLEMAIEELRHSYEVMPSSLPAAMDARFRLALALRYRGEATGVADDTAAARAHLESAWVGVHAADPRRWLYERWAARVRG